MSHTYNYNEENKPVIKIRLEARTREGDLVLTDPIDMIVDTGASHITIPESFLKNSFGFLAKTRVHGSMAGFSTTVDIARLNCRVVFLDTNGNEVYSEQLENLSFALRETNLLGRNVIDGQIYEFNGKARTLSISFHSD